jgi:hypothetical protein
MNSGLLAGWRAGGNARLKRWYKPAALLGALAILAIVPYLRALSLPAISDDYLQVQLGRQYGPISSWLALAADPLYRCRATSILITWWTEQIFGITHSTINWTSLILHIFNTWLVFAAGSWNKIGWRVGLVAAAGFAVLEGHQEAVMWYAALPELLLFFFSVASMILWIRWLQAPAGGVLLYAGTVACFVLALLSKEPGVILVPLLALVTWTETRDWRRLRVIVPFALLAAVYVAGIFTGQSNNQHFGDGTFALDAPFWVTWRNSLGRLFWIWGAIGLVSLLALRQWAKWWPVVRIALIWTALTLLPYCFLTYMPRIPSRHTYLASAGLAMVIAAGFLALREQASRNWRWLPAALATVLILHNCIYIWTRKHAQYLERAAPTEELVRYMKQAPGPVHIHCFPLPMNLAQLAVEIGAGKPSSQLVIDEHPSTDVDYLFCLGDRNHRAMTRPVLAASIGD